MSRNDDVLFSQLPSLDIGRSIFDMPQKITTTFDVGQLIPFFIMEMLPSDSVKINTSKVVRLQTLLTPLMDNLWLDTYYFFVPNRLVWSHWKEFMGENTLSAYLPEVTYVPPVILVGKDDDYTTDNNVAVGDVLDYLGVPVSKPIQSGGHTNGMTPIAFPYRAYQLIWNEFFRDQNLQDPVNINMGDSTTYWKDVSSEDKKPLPVNKMHDIFTSALIAPAKTTNGFAQVNVSGLNTVYPVYAGKNTHQDYGYSLHGFMKQSSQSLPGYLKDGAYSSGGIYNVDFLNNGQAGPNALGFHPDNLWADLIDSSAYISVPNLRQAFQMQKFLERDASHGSRYQEVILSHFKTVAADQRLQRPEYLGGNRIPLNISQVINQTQGETDYLGDVGGMSMTSDSHYDVEWSCQEHGFIIGVCCVRYEHSYPDGLEPFWVRATKFDYYWPEFSHLTDQAVRKWAINVNALGSENDDINDVFGYVERYAEYKFRQNKVTGEMRPGISNSLASWNLSDDFGNNLPYLSDGFIREDKSNVDRALAVTSSVSNQIFADFYVQCRATRAMPVHSNPGLADHF